jgi:elongation factor Ts
MSGVIASYIHTGNRIGALVEVRCQSDAAARTVELQALARSIAMQVVACPTVEYVKASDISASRIERETALELNREDLRDKPDPIRTKIAQGRVEARIKTLCLLNQPYLRDTAITVEDVVQHHQVQLKEQIEIRRFVPYVVDESPLIPPP